MAEFESGFNAYSPALFAPAKGAAYLRPGPAAASPDAFREPMRPIDIEAANVVTARWERAAFGSNLMLGRQLPDGRVRLPNRAARAGEVAADAWRRLPAG